MRWLVFVVACSSTPAPKTVVVKNVTYTVVELRAVQEECSGLGGAHLTFVGAAGTFFGGGHGARVSRAIQPFHWYVAEIEWRAIDERRLPLAEVGSTEHWCLGPEPAYDGVVRGLTTASSRADAERTLVGIPSHGFHADIRID